LILKFSVVVMMLIGAGGMVAGEMEVGNNWEKECDGSFCKMAIYPYQKYYYNGSQMEFLNETWSNENCEGFDYCVDDNLFQAYVNVNDTKVYMFANGIKFDIRLKSIGKLLSLKKNVEIDGSILRFRDVVNNVTLEYQYLPQGIKETAIIGDDSLIRLSSKVSNTIGFTYDLNKDFEYSKKEDMINVGKDGQNFLQLHPAVLYDELYGDIGKYSMNLYTLTNTPFTSIPIQKSNITNPNIVFPVYVDPFGELNGTVVNSTISEDVYVRYFITDLPTRYERFDDAVLWVGLRLRGIDDRSLSRTGIDFLTHQIPDTANVFDINLTLSTARVGATNNTKIGVVHMDGNSTDYPDTDTICDGNCNYYADMGNGTNYTITAYLVGGKHYYNLTNATDDLMSRFFNNSFSIGMYAPDAKDEFVNLLKQPRMYHSSEAVAADNRPVLYVTYRRDTWRPSIFIGLLGIAGISFLIALKLDRKYMPLKALSGLYGGVVLLTIPAVMMEILPTTSTGKPVLVSIGRVFNIANPIYVGMLWVFSFIVFYMFIMELMIKPINEMRKKEY